MNTTRFGSDLWKPTLDKYAEATGLTVELFGADAQVRPGPAHPTPLVALFRECGFDPGLFVECARRCLSQTDVRPVVIISKQHGLTVVGTSLVLEGAVVGAAVAGYALAGFSPVTATQQWAQSAGVPFDRLWNIVRAQAPVPARRLRLHGELLQVLGDALMQANYRTRQYEDAVGELHMAAAAKDEFLAVLSHELRTPLAPIANWANVLKRSKNMEHVRQAAEAIERNALRQSRLVDDLLDVNRISRGTFSLDRGVHELSGLLRAAVETSAHDVESKSIRLEAVYPDEALFVEGDAGRLQQVFGNIVSNAVKFTPAGGSLRVTLGREAWRRALRIGARGVDGPRGRGLRGRTRSPARSARVARCHGLGRR